jgi:hypothetical protein
MKQMEYIPNLIVKNCTLWYKRELAAVVSILVEVAICSIF